MEPQISHATSSDGTTIAYWTMGEGRPLVYLTGGPWNHVEVWEVPQCREWYERLASDRTLVRYDARGTGRSERDVDDFSLDALVADVEAVLDELGVDDVDLFAAGDAGPTAISFGLKHPDRVGRCILWCAYAQGSDFETSPRIQAWRGLIDDDWDLMVETCAHLALGWDAGEIGRRAADAFRASITRETAQKALEEMLATDVLADLPDFSIPTLVLHRSNVSWLPVDVALKLTSALPNSRLTLVEGETTAPYLGNTDAVEAVVPEPAEPRVGSSSGSTTLRTQVGAGEVEIFPLHLVDGTIYVQRPGDDSSWRIALEQNKHPGEVAAEALKDVSADPTTIHSTSWRVDDEGLVLTYAAALSAPIDAGRGFDTIEVHPRELARGTAEEAPESIAVEEVVEHALRHLSWLVGDDAAIREALGPVWKAALAPYESEPFSAFDISGALSREDGAMMCTRYSRPLSQFVEG
jgi:pimeloyl-ACP methyl ester carboxylesterase